MDDGRLCADSGRAATSSDSGNFPSAANATIAWLNWSGASDSAGEAMAVGSQVTADALQVRDCLAWTEERRRVAASSQRLVAESERTATISAVRCARNCASLLCDAAVCVWNPLLSRCLKLSASANCGPLGQLRDSCPKLSRQMSSDVTPRPRSQVRPDESRVQLWHVAVPAPSSHQ